MNWFKEHKQQVRSLVIGTLVFGAVGLGAAGVYKNRQKLANEALMEDGYQTEQTAAETTQNSADAYLNKQQELEEAAKTFRLDGESVVWDGKTYKRNNYTKAIVCIGVDRSDAMNEHKELGEAGQADGVFLLAQDTARNTLKVLMVPRDTITEITLLNPDGTTQGKGLEHLSLAFAHGDGMHESCKNVRESLSDMLYGLAIDHYFATDLAVIGTLNDAVGGVTVTVPMYGMERAGEIFQAGETITLQGKEAERFVRYRDTEVDHSAIFRMNQQREYMTQYFAALKETSKKDSQIIPKLFSLMEEHMVTDMAKEEYMKLALDTLVNDGFQSDNFYMVPGDSVSTDVFDQFYVKDPDAIPLVLELFYREIN